MALRFCLSLLLLSALPFTAFAESRMIFPRVMFQNGKFLGIAIANPNTTEATVKFTAYNLDGSLFSGTGVQNEVEEKIPAGSQYARLATQIFNPPADVAQGTEPTRLWVEVTSSTSGLTGFFLEGNDRIDFIDGSDLSGSGTNLVLPIVENSGARVTELSLVNINSDDANITVDFFRTDGTVVVSRNTVLAKRGGVQAPLSGIFDIPYTEVAGLRIRSDRTIVCSESIITQPDESLITIAAQDATLAAKTLYFPQLAEGDSWSTAIGIANLNLSSKTLVTITAYQPDGSLFTIPDVRENPVAREIPPGGLFRSGLQSLFGFEVTPLRTGWIKVEATAQDINGYVEYGAGSTRAMVAAQLTPYTSSIFSHQAMAPPYFTGLAVLNPGTIPVNVEVFSLTSEGQTIGKTQRVLRPGQKESLLVQQWIPAAAGRQGGSVFLQSDRPVIATQLFGTESLTALANVPPQPVTTKFVPPSNAPRISTSPPLAVVETGKTQQFFVQGATNVRWSVNGQEGGSSETGTITASGLYRAPTKAPAQRALTIQATADAGDRSGGSGIDVVQRETLTGGLRLVTSVAYFENLSRFFVAEQRLLTSSPAGPLESSNANARILEVSPEGTQTLFVPEIVGDTISKMLPVVETGSSYLFLAGSDSGKIYRLNVVTKQLATVAAGLSSPSSLAFDPISGNLLVAEFGADRISVIPRAQILGAPAADGALRAAAPAAKPQAALNVPGPRGIAVDRCSGAIYVSRSDGSLEEYQGNRVRSIAANLDQPNQMQVLYRQGLPCTDGLTLAVVQSTEVTMVFPNTSETVPLVTALDGPVDITFFDAGNPFIPAGESSIGIGEIHAGTGDSLITQIPVGRLYGSAPPRLPQPVADSGANFPFSDPEGDTFATSDSAGLPIPDLVSVDAFAISGSIVITLKFKETVQLGDPEAPESQVAYILLDTGPGGFLQGAFDGLNPFGEVSGLFFDAFIDAGSGTMFSLITLQEYPIDVGGTDNTLTITIPDTAFDLSQTSMLVVVGNGTEGTDVAPNDGFMRLTGD